jgi:hypothetical protein
MRRRRGSTRGYAHSEDLETGVQRSGATTRALQPPLDYAISPSDLPSERRIRVRLWIHEPNTATIPACAVADWRTPQRTARPLKMVSSSGPTDSASGSSLFLSAARQQVVTPTRRD